MLFFSVMMMYFAGTGVYHAKLNYDGYCISENRILSDDEMIRIAVGEMNGKDSVRIHSKNYGVSHENYVPYSSIEEFLKHTPDCCSFGLTSRMTNDGVMPPPGFLSRMNGSHRGYAHIEAVVNYRDGHGSIKLGNTKMIYSMQNCGIIN